jgi:hypothetical protein
VLLVQQVQQVLQAQLVQLVKLVLLVLLEQRVLQAPLLAQRVQQVLLEPPVLA